MLEIVLYIVILGLLLWALRVALRGAPYLPSKPAAISEMVQFSHAGPGKRIAELGSGDGRVAIALAKAGAQVDGYENNLLLAMYSRRAVRKAGVGDRVTIHRSDLWKADFSRYDGIVIFGFTHLMERLARKVKREGKSDVIVVSNAFKIPGLTETGRGGQTIAYRK